MRRTTLAPLLSLLIASAVPPACAASEVALAPGKPAGIKKAQDQDSTMPLLVFGAAALGIGIALALADDGDAATPSTPPPATTTTTAP